MTNDLKFWIMFSVAMVYCGLEAAVVWGAVELWRWAF